MPSASLVRIICNLAAMTFFVQSGFCASPLLSPPRAENKVSFHRDIWGHRPGPKGFSTVILDAGHGGRDSGARSPDTRQLEKDAALVMVNLVRDELKNKMNCVLMRDADKFVDLDERVAYANRYEDAVLVSIHFNSGNPSISGPEVYYWRVDSYTLAKRTMSNLASLGGPQHGNRGLVRRRLRLTRNPQIPCILVECGYLSNPRESSAISTPTYRVRLAHAVAQAILAQRAEGDGNLGPLPEPLYAPLSRPTDPKE
jgi:N-acetylmuramoyl-L-alanine amidase